MFKNQSYVECSPDTFDMIIQVLDGPDSDAPKIIKICKSFPIPGPIVSNGPAMRIEYFDYTSGLGSFNAIYSVRSIGK